MRHCYLSLMLLLGIGCTDPTQQPTLEELKAIRKDVASLSDSLSVLRDSLEKSKTAVLSDTQTIKSTTTMVKDTAKPKTEIRPANLPAPKPKPTAPPKADNDTILHKYVNGKVSVMITPSVNGERKVLFFDLYGNETFSLEEVRHSYSVRVDLHFAQNGSVSKAVVHTNPGASMYWYESEITFTTVNEPVSKIDHRYPQNSLEDMMNEKWVYWDKKTKSWKVQEVME